MRPVLSVFSLRTLCTRLSISVVLTLLLLMISRMAFAQSDTPPRLDERYKNWFQIELVVFERTAYSNTSEIWPKSVTMSYPGSLEHLFSEQEWDTFERKFGDKNALTGANSSSASTSAKQREAEPAIPLQLNTSPFATVSDQEQQQAQISVTVAPLPELETPRIILNRSEHALQNKADAIDKKREFKVLAHSAWRQPLLSSSESRAIAFSGGNLFERHHELEGWIKLSLDRFLHFESNLWKVNYEINYGQNYGESSEYWPSVPAFPDAFTGAQDERRSKNRKANNASTLTKRLNDKELGFGRYLENRSGIFDASRDLTLDSNPTRTSITSFDNVKDSRYIVKEIVTLKQKRRMRSEELHYIDHPRLGILIYVRPYIVELPEPEPIPVETFTPFTGEEFKQD